MTRRLLICASPGELRAAVAEDARLVDFRLARTVGGSRVGEIYLGRVERLLPALRAALVEIGLARPAYLSADDGAPKRNLEGLTEGAAIVVQVKRDARADKAAAVTQRLRLRGRLCDWAPGAADEGVRVLPGRAAKPAAVAAELAGLKARWTAIETLRGASPPPQRLESIVPLAAVLSELAGPDLADVVVDDAGVLAEVLQWLEREQPSLVERLASHRGETPLFQSAGIAEAVARLYDMSVPLPEGESLAIEPTSAAIFIDVDSGALAQERGSGEEAFLAVNLRAAQAIAREVRLRGLAGAIVVDFVGLRRPQHRQRLQEAFAEALAVECGDVQLLGWTRLGHMEMTRPRRRAPLHEIVFERGADGGLIKTPLTVALEALAAAKREAAARPAQRLALSVHPAVAAVLAEEAAPARAALEASLGRSLEIRAEPARAPAAFDIRPG